MKKLSLLWVAALVGPALVVSTYATTEERIQKSVAAPSGGSLVVDVDFGAVEVTTHGAKEVSIDVYRKVVRRSKSAEEEFLKDRPVVISAEDGIITIRSKPKTLRRISWDWGSNSAQYTIRVPAEFNARVNTAGGGIKLAGMEGEFTAHTAGGGLTFEGLTGPLEGNTSGGGVQVNHCKGTLKVSTSGGSISARGGAGTLSGSTSGGGVTVKDFQGPASVSTSGGSITVENVQAPVKASTSGGSVTARLPRWNGEEVKLSTSGGGIQVHLPENSPFNLDASTSGGSVNSELPVLVSGKVSRDKLQGPVNGGGNPVHLRSSGGSIAVKKLPAS